MRSRRRGAEYTSRRLAMRWQVALTELEQALDETAKSKAHGRADQDCKSSACAHLLIARAVNPLMASTRMPGWKSWMAPTRLLSQAVAHRRERHSDRTLAFGQRPRGAAGEPLFETYGWSDDPGHPLSQTAERGASLDQLAAQQWGRPSVPAPPIRAAFDALFAGCGDAPRASIETSSLVLTRAIILESDRLSMLSRRQDRHRGKRKSPWLHSGRR